MKTYKMFVEEYSSYRDLFRSIEQKYPGVNQFMSVASQWVRKPAKLKNQKLKALLRRLGKKSDIGLYTPDELKRIHNFVKDNGLENIEDVRAMFVINPSDDNEDDDE